MSTLFHITHKKFRSSVRTSKQYLLNSHHVNQVWHVFVSKTSLWNGKELKTLAIVDDYTKKVVHIGVDTHLPDLGIIPLLESLRITRVLPTLIFVNNGMEYLSVNVDIWCKKHKVAIEFLQNRTSGVTTKAVNRTKQLEKVVTLRTFITVREALVAAKNTGTTRGSTLLRKKSK